MSSEDSRERLEAAYVAALSKSQRQALMELRSWCVKNDIYWRTQNGVNVNDDATLLYVLGLRILHFTNNLQ